MNILKPDYFDQFACIGGDCPNTCCAGWGDITIDEESLTKYNKVQGPFRERLQENIDQKKKQFRLKEHACPFLDEEHLCEIYKELGEQSMCYTCRAYPRTRDDYKELVQLNLTISCPEVARLLLEHKETITFQYFEQDTLDCKPTVVVPKIQQKLFDAYFETQGVAIDLMQKKDISLSKRLLTTMFYIKNIQKTLDRNMLGETVKMNQQYSNPEYINAIVSQMDTIKIEPLLYIDLVFLLLNSDICTKMLSQIALNNDEYNNIYKKYIFNKSRDHLKEVIETYEPEFEDYMRERTHEYENYFVYMIYETYMKTIKEKNVLKANVMNNIGFVLIKVIGLFAWIENGKSLTTKDNALIMSSYDKAIIHGKQVYEDTFRKISSAKYSQMSYQAALIRTTL